MKFIVVHGVISKKDRFYRELLPDFPYPNSDLENKTLCPFRHCEQLKGACLHAEVLIFTLTLCASIRYSTQAWQSHRKRRVLRFPRNDNFLNRDLGLIL